MPKLGEDISTGAEPRQKYYSYRILLQERGGCEMVFDAVVNILLQNPNLVNSGVRASKTWESLTIN